MSAIGQATGGSLICELAMKMQDQQHESSHASGARARMPPLQRKSTTFTLGEDEDNSPMVRTGTGSLSKKLQGMLKRQRTLEEERSRVRSQLPKFEPRNWKQLTDKQLSKLTPVERSRYLAYEPPSKEVEERRRESLKRVRETRTFEREHNAGPQLTEMIDFEQNCELVGQLKSAEARQRIRSMKSNYQQDRIAELNHLIASQPTSIQAVRLKSFIPPHLQLPQAPEILSRKERIRCEILLEDDKGLTINRT